MPSSSTFPSGGKPGSYGSYFSGAAATLGGSASLAAGAASLVAGAVALAEASLAAPSLESDTDPEVPAAWAKALPATVRLKPQTTQLVSGLDIFLTPFALSRLGKHP